MKLNEFKVGLSESKPPKILTKELIALWHEATGDWEKAHIIVQNMSGTNAAWVHAYLHRKEPDE